MSSLERLKSKIFGSQSTETDLTSIFYLIRELGCLPEVIGREYEGHIKIWKWKIPFKFVQRSMELKQLNLLLQELHSHLKREEREYKKMSSKSRRRR